MRAYQHGLCGEPNRISEQALAYTVGACFYHIGGSKHKRVFQLQMQSKNASPDTDRNRGMLFTASEASECERAKKEDCYLQSVQNEMNSSGK